MRNEKHTSGPARVCATFGVLCLLLTYPMLLLQSRQAEHSAESWNGCDPGAALGETSSSMIELRFFPPVLVCRQSGGGDPGGGPAGAPAWETTTVQWIGPAHVLFWIGVALLLTGVVLGWFHWRGHAARSGGKPVL
ncbi:hypothetical protein NQ036_12925 [Brevibacterium sp. 91QC2O2]|jgi:hypothetical protein|uniref:hypothetical protein n=1 Tax=Brevibacterium TaxID=1696 RepID=UPI00211BB03E|nr:MULTISPECIES: hypothetical protein [unclassified Brevibacterium]MCQ9369142.1 hypothetical protein [Brevibacterium sp. 91QC2O2]MCQ9386499.1 hypothetical protein [Brevibacterium sp. 68QC2CO]